nr:carboxyl transferase domain-containing protein [Rhodococcus sp. HNM0569]
MVANRGEIALRVVRTAAECGMRTVAVYARDDADSPHVRAADRAIALDGEGPSVYLDHTAIVKAALDADATLVHPGYGFLSENAEFARACHDAGLVFVGPSPDVLDIFGDKASARAAAVAAGVPVLDATGSGAAPEDMAELLRRSPGGIMVKAVSGGGGRGIRPVRAESELADAHRVCASEAELGFGDPALFAEALAVDVRHIEVQVLATDTGGMTHAVALGDRDCSVQRRHQKLVEIAPAQRLDDALRRGLHDAAVRLCVSVGYRGLATVEFLVGSSVGPQGFVFLEVNPRLQVEHTVTEEVTGLDLVELQLQVAQGTQLADLALPDAVAARGDASSGEPIDARGIAMQCRVNMETVTADGTAVPESGTLATFSVPSGPGVRVDTYGFPGLTPSTRYDSLLAKVIVHVRGTDFAAAVRKADAALAEFAVDGVRTNRDMLRAVVTTPEFVTGAVTTEFFGDNLARFAGDANTAAAQDISVASGEEALHAPLTGTVVAVADAGTTAGAGEPVVVLEAMKMEHVVTAPAGAVVTRVLVAPGDTVGAGAAVAVVSGRRGDAVTAGSAALDLDRARDDLDEIVRRHEVTLDAARPAAVAKRHRLARRTARENITDLVDDGSFVEYGPLVLAAQRSRRSEEDLIAHTPADGLVGGIATIGAEIFGADRAQAVVVSYDYSVLAGTQGKRNHDKTDRLIDVAARRRVPLVLFAEGGGGRPGDTDAGAASGLDVGTFRSLAGLNGRVPLVSIVSGRCFAGNAALAGVCDVVIATPEANIGMGGPAMIEGGGLGTHRAEDIGPIDVQRRNGVVDLVADDEAHAVALAKQYLSYFQGPVTEWQAPDPRVARHVVPENRLRAYDIRAAIDAIADVGSVLELQRDWGAGAVTAFVRVEGVAYGVVANQGLHLGGAVDAVAADKLTAFLELCNTFAIPVVSLCDTPGFMVGPESERDATVRRFGRLFVAGARMTVPFGTIVLRKGYGLGAMAMAGGSFRAPDFTIAWPTGEIGPMGLEGAVRLGFRKELDAAPDDAARTVLFDQLVAAAYAQGKALTAATAFELDDVIDPADTRAWIRTLGAGSRVGA